ncbi:amidohydrolase [Anaerovorax sp. IOR16]|uniref:amidohydrolase n=1 Tax=Anaerovorax sp. IOR16 TaxID=2773458 RepID=UPI0019D0B99B|nr:amidohydrolase [Anaerovorax sp. IOR16]
MLFKNITVLDEALQPKVHCYVGIKNDCIDYIGNEMPKEQYGEVFEGEGKLLMSGFVNSHAHTPMMLLRGYGENLPLQSWLNDRIFPFEGKIKKRDAYYSTLLGIAESLRYGITSTTDMYFFGESIANAVLESGVKNNLGVPLICFSDQDLFDLDCYQEAKSLFSEYHNAGNGRLKIDMSIHGEYTSTPKTVMQMADYCKELNTNLHVHVSETKIEVEECKKRHQGLTPVQYLNNLGVFENPTTAAHCVWLEEDDYQILKDKQVTVASCPISNLKLASGVCNVPRLFENGIAITIGTDGVASNNNLNFLEDMKFFALVHKGWFSDATLTNVHQVLTAATKAGAAGQKRFDTGSLSVGKKADLIVLDLDVISMKPMHDLTNNLVYSTSGSDVILTMVDGKVLYHRGEFKTIDIERVVYEVEKSKERILGEL